MMVATYLFFGLCILLTVAFCIVRTKKPGAVSLTLKTLASLCFVMIAVIGLCLKGFSVTRLLFLIGGLFGLAGDVLLDLKIMYPEKSNPYFISGTLSFFAGHVFYMTASVILLVQANSIWMFFLALLIGVLLTVLITLSSKKMKLDFGEHKTLVYMYTYILTSMLCVSVMIAILSPIFWIFAAGMLLFLVSDLVLSMQYFGGNTKKIMVYINHILYYLSQCLIALLFVIAL